MSKPNHECVEHHFFLYVWYFPVKGTSGSENYQTYQLLWGLTSKNNLGNTKVSLLGHCCWSPAQIKERKKYNFFVFFHKKHQRLQVIKLNQTKILICYVLIAVFKAHTFLSWMTQEGSHFFSQCSSDVLETFCQERVFVT